MKKKSTKNKPKFKGLFDHIKQITDTQNPNYWDTLNDGDKKSWNNYMVHRFISMNPNWIDLVNMVQGYWKLSPEMVYKFYISVIPKGRTFLRYVKSKKPSLVEKWAMNHLRDYFQTSSTEIEDYLKILTKQQVETIIMKYGITDKQLKEIWKKA